MLTFLSLYWDEVLSEKRFEFYQRIVDPDGAAFFQLLKYLNEVLPEEKLFESVLRRCWRLIYQHLRLVHNRKYIVDHG
jgi:hypothetical protein